MNQPRPESRIQSLENRTSIVEATLIELSSDTAEELKATRQDIKQLAEHVDKGFDQAHAFVQERFGEIQTTLSEHTKRLDTMDSKLDQILQRLPKPPEG